MDKHEYKLCADEIKELIRRKRYNEAMDLADTVDWSRVKNVNMLCTVSDLYKIGRRYSDSREIMYMAYERHPGDRMIVYSLCELSIKLDDVVQAVEYYKEFAQGSPNDNRRFILQYRLYEAQEVTLEERIQVLENYNARERREKWIYELAYLYHRIGLATKCVEQCDELFLWFGTGKYVKKGLELKLLHAPLSPEQQAVFDGGKPRKMVPTHTDDLEPVFNDYEVPDTPQEYDESDMLVAPVNVGINSTINLQRELAAQIQEVMGPEEESLGTIRITDEDGNPQYPDDSYYPEDGYYNVEGQYSEDGYYNAGGQYSEDGYYNADGQYPEDGYSDRGRRYPEDAYYIGDQQYADGAYYPEDDYASGQRPLYEGSETDEIRAFEAQLGNTSDFAGYAAYENSGRIPPIDGAIPGRRPKNQNPVSRSAGNGLDYGRLDQRPIDEITDLDGEENISRSPVRTAAAFPREGTAVGENTGRIVDAMMNAGGLEEISPDEADALMAGIAPKEEPEDIRGGVPTSSIVEITLDNPQDQAPEEPRVVRMSNTGDIPRFIASDGNGIDPQDLVRANAYQGLTTAERMAREGDENYDRLLQQESNGQISLAPMEPNPVEKQITGQISLTDTLLAWEEKKKAYRQRQDAEVQNRIKQKTGEMFEEFDKNSREDLLTELGSLAEGAIRREVGKKHVDIMDPSDGAPRRKKAPLDVAALAKSGVPTDTGVLISQARDVVAGKAPMDNAAVSKIIAPKRDEYYDPATEAAQMDAAVNALSKAAEAKTSIDQDSKPVEDDDDVPIYVEPEILPGVEEDEVETDEVESSEGGYSYTEDAPRRREHRTLTPEEKKLFGPFIQTKGTLNQIFDALENVTLASYTGNIILTGEPGMGSIKLARNLIKEIKNIDPNFSGNMAKITGDALNRKDISRTIAQLENGALIVEGASAIDEETIDELLDILDREEHGIIVILEDTRINMAKLLENNDGLYGPFNLRIDVEAMDNDSLVNFAKRYAQDREFSIDEMGVLALYTRISDLQTAEHSVTTRDVKQIVDEAIEKADKRNITHLVDIVMGKRYNDEDMVILREKDFVS